MNRTVTSLAAGSLLLLAAGSAVAADLGGPRMSIKDSDVGHAPYRACEGDRFAGAYLGGNVGYTGYRAKWEEVYNDFSYKNGDGPAGYLEYPISQSKGGASAGIGLGYNFVRCNFLLGFESDYNFTHLETSRTVSAPYAPIGNPNAFGAIRLNEGMKDFATLRMRMGVVSRNTLWYATGGLAWAKIQHQLIDLAHYDNGQQNQSFDSWRRGWTVGGGFETALSEMVSLKGEALYMDFGKRTYAFQDSQVPPDPYILTNRSTAATVRVGLNFKLGGPPSSSSSMPRCADGGDNCCPDGSSPRHGGHCPLK
jgi:outer membrane immunogenic protein